MIRSRRQLRPRRKSRPSASGVIVALADPYPACTRRRQFGVEVRLDRTSCTSGTATTDPLSLRSASCGAESVGQRASVAMLVLRCEPQLNNLHLGGARRRQFVKLDWRGRARRLGVVLDTAQPTRGAGDGDRTRIASLEGQQRAREGRGHQHRGRGHAQSSRRRDVECSSHRRLSVRGHCCRRRGWHDEVRGR